MKDKINNQNTPTMVSAETLLALPYPPFPPNRIKDLVPEPVQLRVFLADHSITEIERLHIGLSAAPHEVVIETLARACARALSRISTPASEPLDVIYALRAGTVTKELKVNCSNRAHWALTGEEGYVANAIAAAADAATYALGRDRYDAICSVRFASYASRDYAEWSGRTGFHKAQEENARALADLIDLCASIRWTGLI